MAQVPSPETNINNYRQICDYKISKFHTKIDERTRKLPDDPESMAVCETVLEREGGAQITVKFDGNSLYENETEVKFQGPSLSSTCTISGIKEKIYHREIGYIQTSKRFFENEFENAILYSDFHANLLHEQDEVLDCDGESSPFYSTKSCTKVPANEELVHAIELHFSDSPSSDILKNADNKSSETSPKHNWGYLLKHERYQQFFVYIVMRSKIDNKWKYEVVYSFDWFIYLKWIKVTGENNNIFEYNCGLNEHTTNRELPDWINSNEIYTCNDDQFEYWIEKIDCKFNIYNIQKSILQNKLESYTSNVNKLCGNDEITDLKGDKLCKDVESINSEINAFFNDYKSIASGVKNCDKDIENIDRKENIYRKTCRNISAKVRKLYGSIRRLDPIERKDYEAIDSLLQEVNRLCENVTKMDLNKKETFEKYSDVKKLYADRENMDSENSRRNYSNIVGKLYDCIGKMDPIELNIYEDIKRLLPKLKILTENTEIINLKKNDFSSAVDKLCVCIENMNLDKNEFRENCKTLAQEIRKLSTSIEKNDWNGTKESISKNECINFEKPKCYTCNKLDETDLCEIIQNKLFERKNKENFGQVEQPPIEENNGRLNEQDKFSLLPSGAVIRSSKNVNDDS